MNVINLSNDQKKRATVEFSALSEQLDTILLKRIDDDEDDNALLKTGLGLAGAAGAGYGGYQLYKRGAAAGAANPMLPGMAPNLNAMGHVKEGISNIKTGGKAAAGEAKEALSSMFRRLFKTAK